ncbi:MAG: DUF2309 domain-containing protein [Pseudomonadota bacterium]
MRNQKATASDIRKQLRDAVEHLEHVLPAQAPIRDFVHHNTLHSFEQLPFYEAVTRAEKTTGARGFLPEEHFREFYHQGRITDQDIKQVLDSDPALEVDERICRSQIRPIFRRDVYLAAMLHPLKPVTGCQFTWQLEELDALDSFQPDVAHESREQLLAGARHHGLEEEKEAIGDLWAACLEVLGLTHYIMHPEDLVDLSPEQAQTMLEEFASAEEERKSQHLLDHQIRKEADQLLNKLLEQVGKELTLRGLLHSLTGVDILAQLQPMLLRHVSNYLDQGFASWHDQHRSAGFDQTWRHSAEQDLPWLFEGLNDWQNQLESLPDDPLETVIEELRRMGLGPQQWPGYLERLALELPGWSGMFLWRQLHPNYKGLAPKRVEMMDYLAVRLVLERLYAQRLCTELWQVEASLFTLRWYFRHHRPEFLVRQTLFNARLPEYLASRAHHLSRHSNENKPDEEAWRQLAHMIWTWQQSPSADQPDGHSVYRSAWRLFRLSQHLGLCGDDLRGLTSERIEHVFDALEQLTPQKLGYLWLQAYEHHYREELLNALAENHGRNSLYGERPSSQLVFCMDDREEGIRRHLEEIDPTVETLGAAAHFNVFNYWRGLDEDEIVALCPVVAVPSHEIREEPLAGQEGRKATHDKRRRFRFRLGGLLHQEIRRNLLSSLPLVILAAPGAMLTLLGKAFTPLAFGLLGNRLRTTYDLPIATDIQFSAEDSELEPTPEAPRLGFTTEEQVTRAEAFLRNIGLVDRFAPIVVIMGHGSSSQNNPHLAAYDCGACSGRHSGPNARILAAILNRAEVRTALAQRAIEIPRDSWFLGGERNTCNEQIEWYDLEKMPEALQEGYTSLCRSLDEASLRHAHERCRRLASAPRHPTPRQALSHVIGRSQDFSQARPELGHATNAAAFIGRRSMSRGIFYDRRVFLISYDPTTDPSGEVLERLLLANGPVGAGINLEYYFSTVDNENYGCGSKVTHNVTGLFGVMDGASSDLRTGLPRQMIEIHEAMRLQVVVEASLEMIGDIYNRQPPLQELIGNGWLLVSAMDPETGAISLFDPRTGFLPWQGAKQPLPSVSSSTEWFAGKHDPLPPAKVTSDA